MIDAAAPAWVPRWFRGAALYGVAALVLVLFGGPGRDPVYRYGFFGTAIACQWLYWTIGGDPVRHRPLMPVAVLAKLGFAGPVAILFVAGSAGTATLAFGGVDLVIAIGFAHAWRTTPDRKRPDWKKPDWKRIDGSAS